MNPYKGIAGAWVSGLLFGSCIFAQPKLEVRTYNYYTFPKEYKVESPDLEKFTSEKYRKHPEYGTLPIHTPCKECIEILDKRDQFSRFYIEPGTDAAHYYVQSSYFPLHYKDEQGRMISIDGRLRKINSDYFSAEQQPVQTAYRASTHTVSLKQGPVLLSFGDQNRIFYLDNRGIETPFSTAAQDYSDYTAGEDGIRVKEIYPGLEMEHTYKTGAVKTDYILTRKPLIPASAQWLVVEEKITSNIPVQIVRDPYLGTADSNDYWTGDLTVQSLSGEKLFQYQKAAYYDSRSFMLRGKYHVFQRGTDYFIQLMVPVWWLNHRDAIYPMHIDPFVTGYNKLGDFSASGRPGAGLSYTYRLTGSCDYHLSVSVPGKSDIVNAYVDLEYQTELSGGCGLDPLYQCKKMDITEEVISDECRTSSGPLTCTPPPSGVDTPGTCTTDPRLVPGARAILIPTLLDCIAPQCPDYLLHFTLKNRELRCGDNCGNNCASGNMWAITVEARRLEGFILPNRTPVCAGEPVTLTAYPSWGVPPYHYRWSTGDTTRTIVIHPTASLYVSCRIYDTCDILVNDDTLIEVIPSPASDAGDNVLLCEGGSASIGGMPTGPLGCTFIWSSIPSIATTFLTATNQPNPGVSIPAGTIDTLIYIVRVTDATCYRHDTMRVFSVANPHPQVTPRDSQFLCEGGMASFSTTEPYAGYAWSNGSSSSSISVGSPGTYWVTVLDDNGCRGQSDSASISVRPIITFQAYPDTTIDPDQSVELFSNIDLTGISIDTFYWSPPLSLNCDNCPQPVSTPEEDIVYHLHVRSDGCWNEDSATIRINYPFDFYVPNAFTPNGDGFNDVFYLIGSKVLKVTRFEIFDRWGEKLWDLPEPWTGIYKGTLVNPGVYVYFVEVEFKGHKKVGKGSVTLIR